MIEIVNETTPLYSKSVVDLESASSTSSDECGSTSSCCHDSTNAKQHVASIRMFGSVSLLVNELVGPGILDIPATFQRNGLIPTTIVIVVIAVLSAKISLSMAKVISMMPGNTNFSKEVEYSQSFQHFLGTHASVITQLVFFTAMMSQMIASIVETAQVVDAFFGNFAHSVGLQFYPTPKFVFWGNEDCDIEADASSCEPFADATNTGDYDLILTLGYLACAAMFIPIGRMSLEGNMFFQELSYVITLLCCAQFAYAFYSEGLEFPQNMPLWADNVNWQDLIGVVLFNYAIVTAVPSWLYEKAPDVKAESAVGQSCLISSIMYVIVGSFGALSIPNVPPNVLSVLSSGNMGPVASLFASMFTFFIVGLGIPLFSVLIRLNLVGSGFCSERVGQHLTTTLPWAISWILYQGEFVQILMSWGGILMSLIVFVAPLYLACYVTFSSDVSKDALDPSIVDQKATRMEQVELILLSAVSAVVISVALFCQG